MANRTDIANLALIALGNAAGLTDLDADAAGDENAATLKQLFDPARDATIYAHPWNFATRIPAAGLGKNTTTPGKHTNAYTLPTNPWTLRVWELLPAHHGTDPVWEVVGRDIWTDEGPPIYPRLIVRVTDLSIAPPTFAEAMALKLAYLAAPRIPNSMNKREQLRREFKEEIARARAYDGQEKGEGPVDDGFFLAGRL